MTQNWFVVAAADVSLPLSFCSSCQVCKSNDVANETSVCEALEKLVKNKIVFFYLLSVATVYMSMIVPPSF